MQLFSDIASLANWHTRHPQAVSDLRASLASCRTSLRTAPQQLRQLVALFKALLPHAPPVVSAGEAPPSVPTLTPTQRASWRSKKGEK